MTPAEKIDALFGRLERWTWVDRINLEVLYALVLFVGGAGFGGAVTVLLIHFLTGWQ